jgi:hypothetical protein
VAGGIDVSTWLDDLIERNLSWRAEAVLNEIHGIKHEQVEVPDSKIDFWMLASWSQFGRSRLGDKVIKLCQ